MIFEIDLHPTSSYRRAFKRGMTGWDVGALQIGLNSHRPDKTELTIDGDFGAVTHARVVAEQKAYGLVQDGVAGLMTQRAMLLDIARQAEIRFDVIALLLKGLIEGEAGYMLAATTALYGNGTRDLGAVMRNTLMTEQAAVRAAFFIRDQIIKTARDIRNQHDSYVGDRGIPTDRKAWETAILYHNWQAAAAQVAAGTFDGWRYTSRNVRYGVDDPAPWIIEIGVSGVVTARQWCKHYIESKTLYVSW